MCTCTQVCRKQQYRLIVVNVVDRPMHDPVHNVMYPGDYDMRSLVIGLF